MQRLHVRYPRSKGWNFRFEKFHNERLPFETQGVGVDYVDLVFFSVSIWGQYLPTLKKNRENPNESNVPSSLNRHLFGRHIEHINMQPFHTKQQKQQTNMLLEDDHLN